jgi:hypothetical protein
LEADEGVVDIVDCRVVLTVGALVVLDTIELVVGLEVLAWVVELVEAVEAVEAVGGDVVTAGVWLLSQLTMVP